MKYVFTGTYTQFMGRMFAFGKPQDITDRATLEAIRKRPDFKEYQNPEERSDPPVAESQAPATSEPGDTGVAAGKVAASPVVSSDACRKCGKVIGTGRYMHEKYCKG